MDMLEPIPGASWARGRVQRGQVTDKPDPNQMKGFL